MIPGEWGCDDICRWCQRSRWTVAVMLAIFASMRLIWWWVELTGACLAGTQRKSRAREELDYKTGDQNESKKIREEPGCCFPLQLTNHQTSTSFSYWPKFKNHHCWWEVGLQLQPDNFQLNSPQLWNHKAALQMRPVHSSYFFPNIYWVVYFNIKHETTLLKNESRQIGILTSCLKG